MRLLGVWLTVVAALPAELSVTRIIYAGRQPASGIYRTIDRGHLLALTPRSHLEVFGPDGLRVFQTDVLDPNGRAATIRSAAMNSGGSIAVSLGYETGNGYRGGIAFLDRAGKTARFIDTDRFMPGEVCFDLNDYLWTFGWQRDEQDPVLQDRVDYFTARKFGTDWRGAGRYLLRSQFPKNQSPFGGRWWSWGARAAIGKIAVLLHGGNEIALLEIDLDGKILGRYPIANSLDGGLAYTTDGHLYAKSWEPKTGLPRLTLFDRETRAWLPVEHPAPDDIADFARGLLMGSDGQQLVFADRKGYRLLWAKP